MLYRLHIVVPVAIHQVSHQTASSLRQVVWVLLDNLIEVNRVEQDHLLAVR